MAQLAHTDVESATGAELEVGDWQVFPALNRIARDGEIVSLQNLSMRVLLYLSQQPGAVATYDELLESLWPGRYVAEDAVHRRIADLRRKLQDDARAPRYIETIPKRGYRLIATVQHSSSADAPRSHRGRSTILAVLALVVGVLVMLQLA